MDQDRSALFVSDLVHHDGGQWDVSLLHRFFELPSVASILRLPILNLDLEDKWIWTFEKSGYFSIKSVVLEHQRNRVPLVSLLNLGSWSRLWKLKVQEKLKVMLWKVAAGVLRTKGALGRLLHYKFEEGFLCPLCRQASEDTIHLMVHCSVATTTWRESPWFVPVDTLRLETPASLVYTVLNTDHVLYLLKENLRDFEEYIGSFNSAPKWMLRCWLIRLRGVTLNTARRGWKWGGFLV